MLIKRLKPNESFKLRSGEFITNKSSVSIRLSIGSYPDPGSFIEVDSKMQNALNTGVPNDTLKKS